MSAYIVSELPLHEQLAPFLYPLYLVVVQLRKEAKVPSSGGPYSLSVPSCPVAFLLRKVARDTSVRSTLNVVCTLIFCSFYAPEKGKMAPIRSVYPIMRWNWLTYVTGLHVNDCPQKKVISYKSIKKFTCHL